jgi:hypothetical protein
MVILKFRHTDEPGSYHLFESFEGCVDYLEENYENVRIYKNDGSLTTDMATMEIDDMPLLAYIVEPINHIK